MSAVLPLAYWPYPLSDEQVQAIRAAKQVLAERNHLDFKAMLVQAVPGPPTRVLSFAGPPPFAADVAKLRDWRDQEELIRWLEWIFDPEADVNEGFTVADWFAWQIPGAKELDDPTSDFNWEMTRMEAVERGVRFDGTGL